MDNKSQVAKENEKAVGSFKEKVEVIPEVDIYENENEILLHIDMPGVKKEAVAINIDNGTLSLSGERTLKRKGSTVWEEFGDLAYARKFSVPQTIDVGKVEAELKNGVLKLHLPKSEAAKPRIIEVKAS